MKLNTEMRLQANKKNINLFCECSCKNQDRIPKLAHDILYFTEF